MRTTLAVDDRLLELAKERAHDLHLSLGEYVGRAIQTELQWAEAASTASRPPLVTFDGGGLTTEISWTSNAEIWEILDEPDERGFHHA